METKVVRIIISAKSSIQSSKLHREDSSLIIMQKIPSLCDDSYQKKEIDSAVDHWHLSFCDYDSFHFIPLLWNEWKILFYNDFKEFIHLADKNIDSSEGCGRQNVSRFSRPSRLSRAKFQNCFSTDVISLNRRSRLRWNFFIGYNFL